MNVAVRPLNLISLCTGGGGLDRAVELAIPSARPVVCVERESFAVANLVAQMQRGVMAPAAVWSDVRTFPGRKFRSRVDGVLGGIPCQPHSLAGKRLGREDERDLWAPARRIFVQSGAWFILIENVGGMLSSGGAERVYRDLHRMGCAVEGGLFRASEVGLPHERERLFILGILDDPSRWGERRELGVLSGSAINVGTSGASRRDRNAFSSDEGLADPGCAGFQGCGSDGDRSGQRASAERGGSTLADTRCFGDERRRGARKLPAPSDAPEGEGCERQRHGHAADDSVAELEHASRVGRGEGRPEPELRRGGSAVAGADGDVGDTARRNGPGAGQPEAHCLEPGKGLHRGSDREVVDAIGSGRDGWSLQPQRSAAERAAAEWASQGPLQPPGPSDAIRWRAYAELAPERLPAVSRHDRFQIEIRAALLAAHGDPAARPSQAWGDTAPATWLDPQGPYGLRAPIVQAIAQSTLRRGFDGLATRIDELRMLGNGVADAQGALALRTLATDLARRSSGAAFLVSLMSEEGK